MLHLLTKEKSGIWILYLLLLGSIACKQEPSYANEDEKMYFRDYESPADKWGFMDTLGRLVIPPLFDDVTSFSEGLAAANLEGRWGYIDPSGEFVIPPTFKSAWSFHEGLARVSLFDGLDCYVTRREEYIRSADWAAADDFSEGLAKIKRGNVFGFIDTTGEVVLPTIYSKCRSFSRGLAIFSTGEKSGVIDAQGDEILPAGFDQIRILDSAGILLCHTGASAFVYDLNGKEMLRLEATKVIDSDGRLAAIRKDGRVFFMDLSDGKVLPGVGWLSIYYLGSHRWAAKNEQGYFVLNELGKKINNRSFTQINKYADGFAAIYTGEYWGYINLEGKEVTPDVFGLAWDFKNGFARAAFADGIGFLNRKLELAFYPPEATVDMRDFTEGLAPVQLSGF